MKFVISKKNLQVIILIVSMLPPTIYATPSIPPTNGVVGTVAQGATITINGTGFGSKNPVAPQVWADFATTIGPSALGQKSAWNSIDDGTHAFSATVPSGAGTTNGAMFTLDSLCSVGNSYCGYGFMATVPSATKLYTYWKRYFDFSGSTIWNNVKTWRFTNSNFTSDFLMSYGGIGYSYNEGDTSNPDRYFSPWTPPLQSWLIEEVYWQKTGGTGKYKDNSVASGNGVFNYDRNGITMQHLESVNNGSADYVNIYTDNYFAEARPNNGGHIYMKDIYIDNTSSRVIIGNASTLAASTQREIQIPKTIWNDGQIQVQVNQGNFVNGLNAYLFVVDANNVASKGYQVVFGNGGGGTIDTVAPTNVAITAPLSGTNVSGNTAITAIASDNVGVTKFELYVDGSLVGTTSSAPYSFSWNTAAISNGSHTISVRAYDAAGNVGMSSNVTVTVNNTVAADTTAPTVSITAPAAGATVSGNVLITTIAADNVGVTKVELYVNGTLSGTATTLPYNFSWNTTTLTNGAYTLSAKAYDTASNLGTSASSTVTVNNTSVTPTPGTYTVVFGNVTAADFPNTVEDTFIDLNNNVSSTSTLLSTYTWPTNTPANAILMKWNLSALPAGAQIQNAALSLYMNFLDGTVPGWDDLYEIPVYELIKKMPVISKCNGYTYDGLNAWDPSNATGNGAPLAQSDIGPVVDSQVIDKTYGYKTWNVTSIIQDWMTNPANNLGLLLNGSTKASSDSNRGFASTEATDQSQRPKLVVTYTIGVTAPKNLKIVSMIP